MTDKPTKVEPGQVWRDNDERTDGAGEFTVLAVARGNASEYTGDLETIQDAVVDAEEASVRTGHGYAVVRRNATHRLSRIRVDRLLHPRWTKRGYTYIGRSR